MFSSKHPQFREDEDSFLYLCYCWLLLGNKVIQIVSLNRNRKTVAGATPHSTLQPNSVDEDDLESLEQLLSAYLTASEPGLAESSAKPKEMVLRIFKRGNDLLDDTGKTLRKLTNMFGSTILMLNRE